MNTDLDPENELLQLIVEELVRAGLRTPLRDPILAAVEDAPDEGVELVEPAGSGDASGPDGTGVAGEETSGDETPESTGKGPVTKATRGLIVFAVLFSALYLALRRLTN